MKSLRPARSTFVILSRANGSRYGRRERLSWTRDEQVVVAPFTAGSRNRSTCGLAVLRYVAKDDAPL
jgi:hypothetical protein